MLRARYAGSIRLAASLSVPTRNTTLIRMATLATGAGARAPSVVLCSAAFVMMVQTTHFANLNNVAFSGRLGSSRLGGVFAERKVSAPVMVVRCIRGERAAQGAFAEDDHVVQALATN